MTSPTHLSMSHEGKEILRKIVEGLEGVTPGPWFQTDAPWFTDGTGVLAGSPDGNIGFLIADTDDFSMPRDEYEGFPLGDKEADAAHLSRCHPDAIRAIAAYIAAVNAQNEWLKARLAWLQLPSNKHDHDTREKWLTECGMPALKGDE